MWALGLLQTATLLGDPEGRLSPLRGLHILVLPKGLGVWARRVVRIFSPSIQRAEAVGSLEF